MKPERIVVQQSIEHTRFSLRPLRKSDAGAIAISASDPRIAENLPYMPHPYPPGAAEAMIKRATSPDRSEHIWVIDGGAAGGAEFMGLISLVERPFNGLELRIWIAPPFWGIGLASDALPALLDAIPVKAPHITAEISSGNPAAQKLLRRLNFEYIGESEVYSISQEKLIPTEQYRRYSDKGQQI